MICRFCEKFSLGSFFCISLVDGNRWKFASSFFRLQDHLLPILEQFYGNPTSVSLHSLSLIVNGSTANWLGSNVGCRLVPQHCEQVILAQPHSTGWRTLIYFCPGKLKPHFCLFLSYRGFRRAHTSYSLSCQSDGLWTRPSSSRPRPSSRPQAPTVLLASSKAYALEMQIIN